MLHHEIEVADDAATLYLSGALCASDAFTLASVCGDLPARVTTLRLDLHGIDDMADLSRPAHTTLLRAGIPITRASSGLESISCG